MNSTKITNEYYSKWLGIAPETMKSEGVIFIESFERDKLQIGYSRSFKVYTYVSNNLIAVSYSSKLSDKIEEIEGKIHSRMSVIEVANVMEYVFNVSVTSSKKFSMIDYL